MHALIALLTLLPVVFAGDVVSFPAPRTDALALAREYLTAPGNPDPQMFTELRDLGPSGLTFVDEALRLVISEKDVKRASYRKRIGHVLFVITRAAQSTETAPGWQDSPLADSIHESVLLLGKYEILDALDLWRAGDAEYLLGKIRGPRRYHYFPRLVEVFDQASPEDKRLTLEAARRTRELPFYALAFKSGLMEEEDFYWLMRLMMDQNRDVMRNLSTLWEPIGWEYRVRLGRLTEDELRARNRQALDAMIAEVTRDLHQRLRAHDPAVKRAYDRLRDLNGWPGVKLTEEDKQAHRQFLRDLYSGKLLNCGSRLKPVKGP